MSAAGVLEAVEQILDRGGDPEDVLRAAMTAIVDRGGATWAAVLYSDEGELLVGPHAGVAEPGERRAAPIVLDGARIGELEVDGLDDQPLIERIAAQLAPWCKQLL
jgi:hypothetical protein